MRTTVTDPRDNDAALARLKALAGSGASGVARKAQEALKAATERGLRAALGRKPQ